MLKILRVDLCHELQGRGDGKFHYPELLGTWGKTMDLVYGYNEVQYCCNTYQYNDYSRYRQNLFDEADKKRQREEVFPKDLKRHMTLE